MDDATLNDSKRSAHGGRDGGRKKPRKRRAFTAHSGVRIKKRVRDGKTFWLARFRDPDTGRERDESLTALELTTAEARRAWAINKATELEARRKKLKRRPLSQVTLTSAVADFLNNPKLRPKTVQLYGAGLDHLENWAKAEGLELLGHLSPERLARFHQYLLRLKARKSVRRPAPRRKGDLSMRGANEPGTDTLAPATVNQFLRAVRTFLNTRRRMGETPELGSDEIRDSLPFVRNVHDLPTFLRPGQVADLLAACERHDAERMTITRAEAVAGGQPGSTPRYAPIRPFVMTLLLTGMRYSEAAGLRWADVDLQAGEIRLSASATKTGRGRAIALNVCPSLVSMLRSMKLQAGPGAVYVFGENGRAPLSRDKAEAARRRLIAAERKLKGRGRHVRHREPLVQRFGAPAFTWHDLRRTCGTYLTCAPGIYGASSAFLSAKRLGHSVTVAERLYVGTLSELPAGATTLEQAMGLEPVAGQPVGMKQLG